MIAGTSLESLTPESDAIRYILDFDYDMPGGGVGNVVDKLLVERMNRQHLEHSLQNLKALVKG